jgi:hypothetical protein
MVQIQLFSNYIQLVHLYTLQHCNRRCGKCLQIIIFFLLSVEKVVLKQLYSKIPGIYVHVHPRLPLRNRTIREIGSKEEQMNSFSVNATYILRPTLHIHTFPDPTPMPMFSPTTEKHDPRYSDGTQRMFLPFCVIHVLFKLTPTPMPRYWGD